MTSEIAESSLLAILLADEKALAYVDVLSDADFINAENAEIFKAVKALKMAGMPVNMVSVNAKTNGKFTAKLVHLGDYLLDGGSIEDRVKVVKEQAAMRQMQLVLQKAAQDAMTANKTAGELKNDIMQMLDSIKTDFGRNDGSIDMQSVMYETLAYIEERYEKRNDESLYTGFTDLDNATAGLHEEEMTIIAARPGTGKTALGTQIGLKLASKGKKVLFISREMSQTQLGIRFIAGETYINSNRIRKGNLTEDEWRRITEAYAKLGELPIWIDNSARTISNIRTLAREIKNKNGLDALIVDYLQLLEALGKHNTREQEVAEISRGLKSLSLEFKIPVIVMAQLGREADSKRPTLKDMRESGAIEADADNVFALYKPEKGELDDEFMRYYEQIRQSGRELVELIILKQRNGPVGTVYLGYVPQQLKFVNLKFK